MEKLGWELSRSTVTHSLCPDGGLALDKAQGLQALVMWAALLLPSATSTSSFVTCGCGFCIWLEIGST